MNWINQTCPYTTQEIHFVNGEAWTFLCWQKCAGLVEQGTQSWLFLAVKVAEMIILANMLHAKCECLSMEGGKLILRGIMISLERLRTINLINVKPSSWHRDDLWQFCAGLGCMFLYRDTTWQMLLRACHLKLSFIHEKKTRFNSSCSDLQEGDVVFPWWYHWISATDLYDAPFEKTSFLELCLNTQLIHLLKLTPHYAFLIFSFILPKV